MSLGKNHKRFQSKLWNVLQFWIGLNHRVFLGLASAIRERLYVSLCPACNIVDILIKWGPNKWSLRHLLKTLYQPSRVLILRILVWFNKLTLMVEIKVKYLTDIYWLFSIRFVFISPFPSGAECVALSSVKTQPARGVVVIISTWVTQNGWDGFLQ